MHSQYHISHRSVNGNGYSPYEHRGGEVQRPYHQGHLGHHNPPIEEFTYYHEADVEDNVSPKYRQHTNGYHQASSGMSSYGSLTRESSVDSMDFQFPTYDPRTAIPSSTGQNPYANSQSKCRQLPCRTFISCGSCPYGDRCVFLHDPSIVSKPIYVRSKRKSRDDPGVDAFFWPTMPWNAVMGRVDMKNMPVIAQPYIVPAPNSYSTSTSNNDVAVYSMWEHFLDFCKEDPLSIVTVPRKVPLLNAYAPNNHYTGRRRLPVFIQLSQYHRSYYG
eukprot:gene11707-13595_t